MTDATPESPFSAATPDTEIPSDQRMLVMLCHLLSLCGYVIPFGNIIGPLVMWLVKKDESPHVDLAGRDSLNFNLTLTLVAIVAVILVVVGIGICVLIVLPILHLVPVIIATIKASDGKHWRYPATIRFL
jgi:uncharacterized Tic20 family protein